MIKNFFMPPESNMGKTYIWTMMAGVLYAGSSFLMSLITTNHLGEAAAGILALALSIGNQLVTVGYYNIRTFQVSDVLEKYSFGEYCSLRILTITAMIISGIIWILIGGYSGEKLAAIILMIFFKVCEAISDLLEGRYQQKGRYDVSCRGVFVKTLLYLMGFIIALFLTDSLLCAIAVLGIVYMISIFMIDSKLIGSFGGIHISFNWENQIRLILAGLPLFVNAFLTTYILNASKYSIDKYYTSEYLGVFNALYMMAFVINMFASFMLKPMISTMADKYNGGEQNGFVKLIRRQGVVIAGVTVICVAGGYLLGVQVLSLLFGIDLYPYRYELCLMLIGGAFTAVYQLLQYAIVIMRHQYSCLAGCGITALLTLWFNPILTRKYGIRGGALSYLTSMTVMSVCFFIFLLYYLKKDKEQENRTE